ncbi:MAG: SCO family protein [Planctomycetota bacterium]
MNKQLVAVVAFAALGAGAVLLVLRPSGPAPLTPPEGLAAGEFVGEPVEASDPREVNPALLSLRVPAFELTSAGGETVDEGVFEGGYSVAAFVFTNCPLACPLMVERLRQTEELIEVSDAGFVLISVDPEHDTPERLTEFAEQKGLGERWTLLTGPFEMTRRIVEGGLKLTLEEDASGLLLPLEGGGEMRNILHPSRLVLIGPDLRVLDFYDSSSPEDAERLAARLDAIARLGSGG